MKSLAVRIFDKFLHRQRAGRRTTHRKVAYRPNRNNPDWARCAATAQSVFLLRQLPSGKSFTVRLSFDGKFQEKYSYSIQAPLGNFRIISQLRVGAQHLI